MPKSDDDKKQSVSEQLAQRIQEKGRKRQVNPPQGREPGAQSSNVIEESRRAYERDQQRTQNSQRNIDVAIAASLEEAAGSSIDTKEQAEIDAAIEQSQIEADARFAASLQEEEIKQEQSVETPPPARPGLARTNRAGPLGEQKKAKDPNTPRVKGGSDDKAVGADDDTVKAENKGNDQRKSPPGRLTRQGRERDLPPRFSEKQYESISTRAVAGGVEQEREEAKQYQKAGKAAKPKEIHVTPQELGLSPKGKEQGNNRGGRGGRG